MKRPEIGSRWRHHSHIIHADDLGKPPSHKYTVIGLANTGNKNPAYPVEVVYQGDNGLLWIKRLAAWPGGLIPVKEKPMPGAIPTPKVAEVIKRIKRDARTERHPTLFCNCLERTRTILIDGEVFRVCIECDHREHVPGGDE